MSEEKKFVVRLYDYFEFHWIDISKPVNMDEAKDIWNKYTENGTKMTEYAPEGYYEIFPADTVMRYSLEGGHIPFGDTI